MVLMLRDKNKILIDTIKRLIRRGANTNLQKIVDKTHAADLSHVFKALTLVSQRKLFGMIGTLDKKATLFSELDDKVLLDLVNSLPLNSVVEVLESMASDDAAQILGKLPQEISDMLLEKMKLDGSSDLHDLLSYEDDTAGRIMVTDFIALKEDMTAKEAIEAIQTTHKDAEMVFYLYVVDAYSKLVGVLSLRQLVVVPPDTPLKEFMATDIFSVRTDMDQEEVARIVARYDILAVPVVDESNTLVGIITVDDVIDIFREEATEDFLKMAGVGEEYVETQSVFRSTRTRLPWLFASCLGGILAFFVISGFETSLQRFTYLAAFIPVIMGMGGNIGTQSSTIVVRGLATGRLHLRDFWPVVTKELLTGLILGLVYGALIALVAQISFYETIPSGLFAVSVGMAVISSMSVAALVGSLVPMLFARINVDPAVATGPFVTTAIDIISVYFYFSIATTLLGI